MIQGKLGGKGHGKERRWFLRPCILPSVVYGWVGLYIGSVE